MVITCMQAYVSSAMGVDGILTYAWNKTSDVRFPSSTSEPARSLFLPFDFASGLCGHLGGSLEDGRVC